MIARNPFFLHLFGNAILNKFKRLLKKIPAINKWKIVFIFSLKILNVGLVYFNY